MDAVIRRQAAAGAPLTARSGPYSQEEMDAMSTEELLTAYRACGDEDLKWAIVLRCTGLVKSIALQIRGVYSSFAQIDDIINEGILALLGAVDKFDPEKGRFETYVVKRIRGMIIDLARRQDWVPRSARKRAKEIDQAASDLYYQTGHFPTDAEIAASLGLSDTQYQDALLRTSMSNVLSLESLFEEKAMWNVGLQPEPGQTGEDFLPEDALLENELHEVLTAGIRTLRDNEQLVLSLYYQENLNMKEISQVMGVSEPRVSQIHAKAIQRLRLYIERYLHT